MHSRIVTLRSREARLRVSESYREIGERIATLTGNNPLAEVAPAPRKIRGNEVATRAWDLKQEEINAANAAALATLIAAIPEKALAKAALATFGHTGDAPEPDAQPAPATEPDQETPAVQADLIEAETA